MAELPAPLLSRQVGVTVLVLSVVAAAALFVLPPLGFWPFAAALGLAAVHHAFVALAVLIVGRTGLAGRHRLAPVAATLGSAAGLLLGALTEVILGFVAGLLPGARVDGLPLVAGVLAAVTGLLLTLFGVAVLHAGVVRRPAGILTLLGGFAVLAAAVALVVDPFVTGRIALAVATLLLGGVGFALFTPRRVASPSHPGSA